MLSNSEFLRHFSLFLLFFGHRLVSIAVKFYFICIDCSNVNSERLEPLDLHLALTQNDLQATLLRRLKSAQDLAILRAQVRKDHIKLVLCGLVALEKGNLVDDDQLSFIRVVANHHNLVVEHR